MVEEADQARQTTASPPPGDPRITDHLVALASAARAWLADNLSLVILDGQLAGVSLVRMLIYGVVAALMFVTAWVALMFALANALSRFGVAIELIAIIVAVVCVAAGIILVRKIGHLSENITFQTTRRRLQPDKSGGLERDKDHSQIGERHKPNQPDLDTA